ncbi:MAG: aspartyl protease family protein [Methyloceanibacter sp.]|jgi:tetratricopeptide (TPR) repeat protein|nr:aspartyl protease family protein [Gemmataceae bacterium]HYW37509.1 aspartyl protease family protein [Terriglobales bacterium]
MTFARICIALAVILASWSFSGQAAAQPKQADIDAANRLFQTGKFAEAGEIYARMAAQDPKDYSAILQLGRIALLSNRLDDAQKWLERTIALQPDDADAKVMLAEAFYRRDDFQKAAASLNGVEVSSNKLLVSQYPTLNVAKLESFKGQTPYEVQGDGQTTRLKFLKTDPLPLVSVRVNGGDEVTFFIDTGASEVALDTDFARELGVPQFGAVQGTFAGGQHAEVQNGRIESLTVGDWTVKNLPIATLALRQLSEGFGVKRIDGIIGTNLLYHFLATLDYPHAELVLRRKTAKNLEQFAAASSGKSVAVPFWIASDHFMVGWGRVETIPPTLLFVDSGLAGAGVKLAEPVIKEAGIKLEEDKAYEGAGGGGKLKLVPYTVRQLSFGDVQESNVPGIYDGPFPWENTFGFHLAGMVGHDFFKPYAVTFDFENMQIFLQ